MSSSNTQINFISSSVIKFLKKKFTYDDSFDTVISLLIITCITNIYTILSYINEDNIKKLFNDEEFISNFRYYIKFVLMPIIKLALIIYILYYIKINKYHIFIYNLIYNLIYKSNQENQNSCKKIEPHIIKNKEICKDKKINTISYDINISNLPSQINIIYKFMDYHPDFFKRKLNYKLINYINSENKNQLYPVFDGNVTFNDPIHNVYGYLNTRYSSTTNKNDEIVHNYSMVLHINKNEDDNKCYIKQLENYTKRQTKYGNLINLFYYKILPKELITYNYYNEEVNKWTEDCKTLKDSYFSIYKNFIFNIMESKADYNLASSNGWNNLLLYGPPGSGKSTIINRIGTILKRSILSVDISLYLDKKKDLYSLFHGQEFSLPDSDKKYNINNFIIILEEFDNCIDKLVNLEKIYEFKTNLINTHFEKKQKDILDKMEYIEESESESDDFEDRGLDIEDRGLDIENIENNAMNELIHNNLDDKYSNIGKLLMENNHKPFNLKEFNKNDLNEFNKKDLNEKIVVKLNKKSNKKNYMKNIKKDVDRSRSFDNNIGVIDRDIRNIIKTNNEEMKSDTLRLADLLELFQGPIQIKDRLIIATTNHYDKIKNTLPALFRHGRLTPLEFKYLDWNTLNLLCIYYFDKKMKHHPIDINISTSQIIELAIKHSLSNNNFDEFENELLIELHKKLI
jgi:hypothetical protein